MPNINVAHSGGFVGAVTVTDATTVIQAEDANRQYLILFNNSTTVDVWLAIGCDAEVGKGIPLKANGGWYEMTVDNIATVSVNGITASGTASVSYQLGK